MKKSKPVASKTISEKQELKDEPSPTKSKSVPKEKKSLSKDTSVKQLKAQAQTRVSRSSKLNKSSAKVRQSKSAADAEKSANESEQEESIVLYKEDTFVAFIDRNTVINGKQEFTIGQILKNVSADDKEISLTIFDVVKKKVSTYVRTSDELKIKDFQVVCSVEVETLTKSGTMVKLSQKAKIEVNKLFNTIFDSVRDKINDEEDQKQEEEEQEEEQSSVEQEESAIVTPVIVRAKRNLPAVSQQVPKSSSAPAKAIAKSAAKEPSKPSKKKKSKDQSEVEDDEQDNEDDEDFEVIVKVGEKRAAPAILNKMQSQQIRKVKKVSEESGQTVQVSAKQSKKSSKKLSVFKIGKWNPDTVLLKENDEKEKFDTTDKPIFTCCLRCNCRNLIRAVETNNIRLLKASLNAKDQIPHACEEWSVDSHDMNPLEMILKKKNLDLLEAFFKIPIKKLEPVGSEFEYSSSAHSFFITDRVKVKEPLLTRVDTGKVSYKAYGSAIRQVQQTRGNRQGNQAFIMPNFHVKNPRDIVHEEWFLRNINPDMYKAFTVLCRLKIEPVNQLFGYALAGNIEMLIWIIEPLLKNENYGFNKLHLDVLKLQKLTEKYHTASITKKAANSSITPLHFACLNPNKAVIQTLLEQNNDINVFDQQNNKPIHYAAICSSSGPLQVLLEKGANVFDSNTHKKMPLHYAAMNSRGANVKVILENNLAAFKYRDKTNKTAFTYACEIGDIETIKAFLDYSQGKIKINTGQGPDRMTPLMYAAAAGRYELVEFLLERKARVLSKDKYKRTALIMAIRNGHTRVASLLLQQGSDWKHLDSSNNTALHYAAGSGFIECVDLLVKHGADLNAMNSWKVTPITIAMLNNHLGTVKRFLQEDNVDVNGKDDKGRTLLSMAVLNLEEPGCVDFAKYLLDKGADVNMGDVDKTTPLHILAGYKFTPERNLDLAARQSAIKNFKKNLNDMIDLFLLRGADLSAKTEEGKTPFEVALDENNIEVLEKFIKAVRLSADPQLLHKFKNKIFDERFSHILIQLLNQETNLTPEIMNHLDKEGFSPFLIYIRCFVEALTAQEFHNRIRKCLEWNAWKFQLNYNRYTVTNQLLYDTSAIEAAESQTSARDVQRINELKMQDLIKKYLYELFTLPFIELLKIFISKGADPHMKVGKTAFYRELDEHKRNLLLVNQQREGVDAMQHVMQIDTMQKSKVGDVKTRKEAIAEQRLEKKSQKRRKGEKNQKRIEKPFKEFYAKKGHMAQFIRRDGKLIEIEYNKEYGMQNAIHLIFRQPSNTLFDFLSGDLGIPIDETDFMGRNPFIINTQTFASRQMFFKPMEKLLEKNVRFDLADLNGRTPFLIFYENSNFALANRLLDKGANINQMDTSGLFALKYAMNRRQNDEIQRLVSKGANINQIDQKGRNLLHHAVNMSSATADATFETEQLLIDLGVNINLRDNRGRVPLHYAFVKLKNWKSSESIDPIETVSSLCGQPNLDIEVADKWQKTPLHYAAQRSASISTIYILKRGANMESKDIYGNTALGIAILKKHFNYAILLIQSKCNVCLPIYEEFPNRIAKQWADEEKEKKKLEKLREKQAIGADVNMEENSESDSDENVIDTGRDLFKKQVTNKNVFFRNFGQSSSEEDESDDNDYDEEEENDMREQQVFNQQNAFGMQIYQSRKAYPARKAKMSRFGGRFNGGFGGFGVQPSYPGSVVVEPESKEVEKEKPPKSGFRLAIQNQQQGLAYLILDNGYDYMLAMQDALDDKKFNLVLTLLSKTADDRIVQKKNDQNQNLMHILAKNSTGGLMHTLKRIYDTLKKRGVNCLEQDSLGNNALHYAVQSRCYDLSEILLTEGINVNALNKLGHSPLSLLMMGPDGAAISLRPVEGVAMPINYKHLFTLLADNGADMNIVYPEDSYGSKDKDYKCSIMINIVQRNIVEMDKMRSNLQTLFQYGATLKPVDSYGSDVIMHAIMQNNEELVQFFLNNADKGLIKNHKDLNNKTAIHYIVNPHNYGSFENIKILNMLLKNPNHGYDIFAVDKSGKNPLDYALLQRSGVLSNALQQRMGLTESKKKRNQNFVLPYHPQNEWAERLYDFDEDSRSLLQEAENKRVKELLEEKKDSYIPLDVAFAGEKQYKVYFDGEDRRPYDAYMTKVDLKNGYYGDYTFYKMQMVYDSNRDLYIVLTRYGRIGEEGMNQRTPFNTVEDAKKEFHTIFKQKSSNEWETALDNFEKHPKKYVLIKVHYSNVKHQDYLAPFDYENCPNSKLDKVIRVLIEEISNVTMYQRSLQEMGIDQEQLPISNLKIETIKAAKQKLNQLAAVVKELQQLRASQYTSGVSNFAENYDKTNEIFQQLSDLTSQFYQLIPMRETKYWDVRPISEPHLLQKLQEQLETLTNIEYSSRLLLGALYKQKIVNPVDYVYDCIQTQIQQLKEGEPEFDLIQQFIRGTCQEEMKKIKFQLFKVERRGEGERFEKFQHLDNRRLLFHGSAMTNMLGILSQGLRIAPPEAPTTGYMFGKGLYFADLFKKSANYSHVGAQTKLMFMCEVALGNMMELYRSFFVEKLPEKFDSVKAIGQFGGNYKHKTIVTPEGFQVPLGDEAKSEEPSRAQFMAAEKYDKDSKVQWNHYYNEHVKRFMWPLQANEYIVFNTDQVKIRYMIQWE